MQTYVAEIDGRAIFAFRADDVACAQAWLDIHAVMRHALETVHSDGRPYLERPRANHRTQSDLGRSERCGRELRDEVAATDRLEEPDNITVWLIPTSGDQRSSKAP